MIKEYKDERINELIKKSFEHAIKDSEWNIRYLSEWNILFDDIDKILQYVDNGKVGELRLNANMWYILSDTLMEILNLYDLELVEEKKVSENQLVKAKINDKIKQSSGYKFFKDLVYDTTDDYRQNEGKEYDIEETIMNLYDDDDLWQEMTNAIWRNLVEITKGDE